MGQQLIGRPVSQRSSFSTLNTPSSALSPDLSQFAGFITPPQAPALSANPGQLTVPSILGFGGYRGGMGGFNSLMGARQLTRPMADQ